MLTGCNLKGMKGLHSCFIVSVDDEYWKNRLWAAMCDCKGYMYQDEPEYLEA